MGVGTSIDQMPNNKPHPYQRAHISIAWPRTAALKKETRTLSLFLLGWGQEGCYKVHGRGMDFTEEVSLNGKDQKPRLSVVVCMILGSRGSGRHKPFDDD